MKNKENIEIKNINELNNKEKEEFEIFFENGANKYFKQSLKWENFNDTYVLSFKKNGKILSASIFYTKSSFLGKAVIQEGGPIFSKEIYKEKEYDNINILDVFENMYNYLIEFMENNRKIFAGVISLNLSKSKKGFEDRIKGLGFAECKYKNEITDRIQNPYEFVLSLEEDIEKIKTNLSAKARYNIRIEKEKGAKIDILNYEEALEKNLINKRKIKEKRLEVYVLSEEGKNKSIAQVLNFQDTKYLLDIKDLGNDENVKYYLIWEIIKKAKEEKLKTFNLGGFPGIRTKDLDIMPYEMYRFKKEFNGELIEKLPEYVYVKNNFKYKVFKSLRK